MAFTRSFLFLKPFVVSYKRVVVRGLHDPGSFWSFLERTVTRTVARFLGVDTELPPALLCAGQEQVTAQLDLCSGKVSLASAARLDPLTAGLCTSRRLSLLPAVLFHSSGPGFSLLLSGLPFVMVSLSSGSRGKSWRVLPRTPWRPVGVAEKVE